MNKSLRSIMLFGGMLLGSVFATSASAQSYPSREITLVSSFPAGTGADLIVRWLGERLKVASGQIVLVENKVGAQGSIGAEYVARSKPDGHTILVGGGTTLAANMYLFKKPSIDAATQLRVAATLHRQAVMLIVAAHRPWKTIADLTAHLKSRGDQASYSVTATAAQVLGEVYKSRVGINAVQIIYRTPEQALNELMSDKLDFSASDPVFAFAQQREGRVRILGISTPTRLKAAPDLPTLKEQGVDIDLTAWWAASVPAATPTPVVEKINSWINAILATDEAVKFFRDNTAGDPLLLTPDEANALLRRTIKEWGEYMRLAKIEPT